MAPRAGLEPATKRLTAAHSTIELPGNTAAEPGFEPGLKDPKSFVLPLHNSAITPAKIEKFCGHPFKFSIYTAEGRSRTDTGVAPQQFLRLPRLPFRHFGVQSAEEQSRTADTRIFSPLLYHLSYLGRLKYSRFSYLRCQAS